jgi:hypothetical protein
VKDRLLIAICNTEVQSQNNIPHLILLTKAWEPKEANAVLDQTCLEG